jgi:hypothetical protein
MIYKNLEKNEILNDNKFDICIIGAGAAGIYLAKKLSDNGQKVVLVEAGNFYGVNDKTIGFEPIFKKSYYSGASLGRYFGIGGATYNWGGYLIPFSESDINNSKTDNEKRVWQLIIDVIYREKSDVLRTLGVTLDFEKVNKISEFSAIKGIYLPFSKKNFSYLLKKANEKLTVYYNAVVYDYEINSQKINYIKVKSKNHNELKIYADKFIITSGVIESARQLLEIKEKYPNSLSKNIGKFFSDHISWCIAKVDEKYRKIAVNFFTKKFQKGYMRSIAIRDIFSKEKYPRAFVSFQFSMDGKGFDLIKAIMYSIQHKKINKISVNDFLSGLKEIVLIAYNRIFYSRLYVPNNKPIYVNMDIEQEASIENYIELSDKVDEYGRKKVNIHWEIKENDRKNIEILSKKFLVKWNNSNSVKNKKLPKLISNKLDVFNPHDVYHPAGTNPIGFSEESVLKDDLSVRGVENLYVVNTGIFPTAGSANNTFSMLCFANRLYRSLAMKENK